MASNPLPPTLGHPPRQLVAHGHHLAIMAGILTSDDRAFNHGAACLRRACMQEKTWQAQHLANCDALAQVQEHHLVVHIILGPLHQNRPGHSAARFSKHEQQYLVQVPGMS